MTNPNDIAIFAEYMEALNRETLAKMSVEDRAAYDAMQPDDDGRHSLRERYGQFDRTASQTFKLMRDARKTYWARKRKEVEDLDTKLPDMLVNLLENLDKIFHREMSDADYTEWKALRVQINAETISSDGETRYQQILDDGLKNYCGELETVLNIKGGNVIDMIRRYPEGPPGKLN